MRREPAILTPERLNCEMTLAHADLVGSVQITHPINAVLITTSLIARTRWMTLKLEIGNVFEIIFRGEERTKGLSATKQ